MCLTRDLLTGYFKHVSLLTAAGKPHSCRILGVLAAKYWIFGLFIGQVKTENQKVPPPAGRRIATHIPK
ncbi:MAG: hypothetical protein CEE38_02235 [Planctomycetes bacterium B3_Pla]|nr:MAG: hypothetical protein CEE38_02235 [Planctomycetes bacterium B3_Pla]